MIGLKKILFSSLVLVLCVTLVGFYLRQKGLNVHHEELSHPYFSAKSSYANPAVIAYQGLPKRFPPNSLEGFQAAAAIGEDIILWADVRFTHDHTFFLLADKELSSQTNGVGEIIMHTAQEIENLDAGFNFKNKMGEFDFRGKGMKILKLDEFLRTFPHHRLILNMCDHAEQIDTAMKELITKYNANDRVVIHSERDGVLRDFRNSEARWLYGSSRPLLSKLKIATSLGLGPALNFAADIMIGPLHWNRLEIINHSMVDEVLRRHKRIFIGPIEDREQIQILIKQGVNGIITPEADQLHL